MGGLRFPVPRPVLEAITRLEEGGHEAYLVGGCVRDDYLGILPHDYDLTTSATPEIVKKAFSGCNTIDTGLRHGTVTVLSGGLSLEITTFRTDGPYTDGRHPDAVQFGTDLTHDLARRDFTMNAMAWSPTRGWADPFGGRADCDRGLIRAVGLPLDRFREDALRILRALRFAATLDFRIEDDTLAAMYEQNERLNRLSAERVLSEMNALLLGKRPASVFRRYAPILFDVLPETRGSYHCPQRSKFHRYDVWEHTLHALEDTPNDLAVRWAVLLHDAGKPEAITYDADGTTHFRGHPALSVRIAEAVLTRLKAANALKKTVMTLVEHHDDRIGPDNAQWWLSKLGYPLYHQLLLVQRADLGAHAAFVARHAPAIYEKANALALNMLKDGTALRLGDLKVSAEDLIALGYPRGPLLGQTLERLLEMVLRGNAENDRDALLVLARARLRSAFPQAPVR